MIVDSTSFNFQFLGQSAFVNNHLLCFWPTIHNSVLKIYPEFQVLSSHFSEVNDSELLNGHWAKMIQSENILTPIYVQGLEIFFSAIQEQQSCKKKHLFNVAKFDKSFQVTVFSEKQYEPIA